MNYAPFSQNQRERPVVKCTTDDSIINAYLDDFMKKDTKTSRSTMKSIPNKYISEFDTDYQQKQPNIPTFKAPIDIDSDVQPYDQGSSFMFFDDYFNKNHMFGDSYYKENINKDNEKTISNKKKHVNKKENTYKKNNKIIEEEKEYTIKSINNKYDEGSLTVQEENYYIDDTKTSQEHNSYNNYYNNFGSYNLTNVISEEKDFDESDDESDDSFQNNTIYTQQSFTNDNKINDIESRIRKLESVGFNQNGPIYIKNSLFDTIIYIILGIFLIIIFEQILKFGKYLHTPMTILV